MSGLKLKLSFEARGCRKNMHSLKAAWEGRKQTEIVSTGRRVVEVETGGRGGQGLL